MEPAHQGGFTFSLRLPLNLPVLWVASGLLLRGLLNLPEHARGQGLSTPGQAGRARPTPTASLAGLRPVLPGDAAVRSPHCSPHLSGPLRPLEGPRASRTIISWDLARDANYQTPGSVSDAYGKLEGVFPPHGRVWQAW